MRYEIKNDAQSLKTKSAIKKSLMQLLLRNQINNIKISELVSNAHVSRSSFYYHYYDIYEVIEDIENDIDKELYTITKQYSFNEFVHHPSLYYKELVDWLLKDSLLLDFIMSSTISNIILEHISTYTTNQFIEVLKLERDITIYDKIITSYTQSGLFSLLKNWYFHRNELDINSLMNILDKIVAQGILSIKDS